VRQLSRRIETAGDHRRAGAVALVTKQTCASTTMTNLMTNLLNLLEIKNGVEKTLPKDDAMSVRADCKPTPQTVVIGRYFYLMGKPILTGKRSDASNDRVDCHCCQKSTTTNGMKRVESKP